MSGFGAKAYSKLSLETDVLNADPHRLVLILFDGALLAVQRAKGFLAERRVAEKCSALDQAIRIVDGGLRVSVDPSHDPAFAGRLVALYNYITMRLLQANLRNDVKALEEAAGLLSGLRDAWVKIEPSAAAGANGSSAYEERAAHSSAAPAGPRALHAYGA
ncbi:flagellar protein potentiates polymerization (modular protein) [Burkholderiales bacterium]|nr:flagellar protein potentiates polymerization (modular protein) [Burkholderiales bacterium]